MGNDSVEVVGPKRAVGAARLPARAKHEMINQKLVLSVEKLSQGFRTVWAVESIFFFNLHPRELASLPAQLIAEASEFLLFGQQRFASSQPNLLRYNTVFLHACSGL